MRTLVTIFGLLFCMKAVGQNCLCAKDSILSQIINCDTIKFDNQAKLYWNFNCDSSWLTFESLKNKREIIFSLGGGFIELTGRLGLVYATEYKHTFLMRNNVISGCCDPPEFFLYDKTTGQENESLGRILFYGDKRNLAFVISITGSVYDDSTSTRNYDSLTVYNVDKQTKYFIKLPKGEIKKALEQTEEIFPEYLFDEPIINGKTVILTYRINKPSGKRNRQTKTIMINLKKYN